VRCLVCADDGRLDPPFAPAPQFSASRSLPQSPRGRCTYTAGLDSEGLDIQFGPAGETYALLTSNTATLHAAGGEGGLVARLDSEEVRLTALGRQRTDER
jgi:hypothetical protein